MAKLTAAARRRIPAKDFAGPDRSFPIENASHARNALARVANKSPALKAEVRRKVHAKYPSIGGNVKEESMHTRGHHENQFKAGEKGQLSHEEFTGLNHGGKQDHMPQRKPQDFEKTKGY